MESRDKELQPQPLSDVQVVASCDSSGVTFVNEETPLHLAENGLYEIAYINISEEDMVSELELMESVNNDDDSSRQSFPDHFEVEEVDDSDDDEAANADDADLPNADEEQIAITNDFLTGKISFQDFITRVENSDDSESGMEDSSDSDNEEKALEKKTERTQNIFLKIYLPRFKLNVNLNQVNKKKVVHLNLKEMSLVAVLSPFHNSQLHPQ